MDSAVLVSMPQVGGSQLESLGQSSYDLLSNQPHFQLPLVLFK